jgi:septum formation inhibitor MinC
MKPTTEEIRYLKALLTREINDLHKLAAFLDKQVEDSPAFAGTYNVVMDYYQTAAGLLQKVMDEHACQSNSRTPGQERPAAELIGPVNEALGEEESLEKAHQEGNPWNDTVR